MSDNRKGTAFYRFVRMMGSPYKYKVAGLENVQGRGPALFVANHLGSIGPMMSILSVPLRFHPWVIAEMLDFKRAPLYLYDDFVHPTWRLEGRLGMVVATVLSKVTVRLLRGLGSISVERNAGEPFGAFRHSLALLLDGENLLVFPEDEKAPAEAEIRLHPFFCGFVGLCGMYERACAERLPIYPMAVYPETERIAIGTVQFLENAGDRRQDVRRTCDLLREQVAALYRGLMQQTKPG